MITHVENVERELRIRNYSAKTIKSYRFCLIHYFSELHKDPSDVTTDEIKNYLHNLYLRGKSSQSVSVYLNAIKFFYSKLLKTRLCITIKYPQKEKHLPVVFNRCEIQKIIQCTRNEKHRLMISLAYGAGLRVSELLNLRVKDIDFDNLTIHIKQAKGHKDRITILSDKLSLQLQDYIENKTAESYIFCSERGGS